MEEKLIGRIEKNKTEEIAIRLKTYNGHPFLDVRAYADFDRSGEMRPTKKGVTLKLTAIPELIELLQTAASEAERLGLISTPEQEP